MKRTLTVIALAALSVPGPARAVGLPAEQQAAPPAEIAESALPAWAPAAVAEPVYWGIALGLTLLGTAAVLAVLARRAAAQRRHEMGEDLMRLLVGHQEGLRDLYRAWAVRFPAAAATFTPLAEARERQARTIEALFARTLKGEGRLRREDFPTDGVRASRARLASLDGGGEGAPASAEEALVEAYALESGVIEGGFLARFEPANRRFETASNALAGEGDSQRDLLRRGWEKLTGRDFASLGKAAVYGKGPS